MAARLQQAAPSWHIPDGKIRGHRRHCRVPHRFPHRRDPGCGRRRNGIRNRLKFPLRRQNQRMQGLFQCIHISFIRCIHHDFPFYRQIVSSEISRLICWVKSSHSCFSPADKLFLLQSDGNISGRAGCGFLQIRFHVTGFLESF